VSHRPISNPLPPISIHQDNDSFIPADNRGNNKLYLHIDNINLCRCPLQPSLIEKVARSIEDNHYPPGVVNPAFTGMVLWELRKGHPCNHYMIPREHNIKKGLVFRGNEVYVYTPIINNDLKSYFNIILTQAANMTRVMATKISNILISYVRSTAGSRIIPSINDIRLHLKNHLKIVESSYPNDFKTFQTLQYRIYLIIYML